MNKNLLYKDYALYDDISEAICRDLENVLKNEDDAEYKYFNLSSSIDNYFGEDVICISIGAELDYDALMDLAEKLDPIIQRYDPEAYCEPADVGILEACVRPEVAQHYYLDKSNVKASTNIFAADEDEDGPFEEEEDIEEEDIPELNTDEVEDILDDEQEDFEDDIAQDSPAIETENNLANHFIAECDVCKGIYISPVVNSSTNPTSVEGTCPICGKDTTQTFRWIISDFED